MKTININAIRSLFEGCSKSLLQAGTLILVLSAPGAFAAAEMKIVREFGKNGQFDDNVMAIDLGSLAKLSQPSTIQYQLVLQYNDKRELFTVTADCKALKRRQHGESDEVFYSVYPDTVAWSDFTAACQAAIERNLLRPESVSSRVAGGKWLEGSPVGDTHAKETNFVTDWILWVKDNFYWLALVGFFLYFAPKKKTVPAETKVNDSSELPKDIPSADELAITAPSPEKPIQATEPASGQPDLMVLPSNGVVAERYSAEIPTSNKTSEDRKTKLDPEVGTKRWMPSAISAAGVVGFLLFFHIVPTHLVIFPKQVPSFANTFVDIDDYLKQYHAANFIGQIALSQTYLHQQLIAKGLIVSTAKN